MVTISNVIQLDPVLVGCSASPCRALKVAEGHPFYSTCRHSAANAILHSPALISRCTDNVIMEVSRHCSHPGNSNYLQGGEGEPTVHLKPTTHSLCIQNHLERTAALQASRYEIQTWWGETQTGDPTPWLQAKWTRKHFTNTHLNSADYLDWRQLVESVVCVLVY